VASQMRNWGIKKNKDELIPLPVATDEMAKPRVHTMIARKLRTVPTAKANKEMYAFPSFDPQAPDGNRTILEVARATTDQPRYPAKS
jgi:hypothetical protein